MAIKKFNFFRKKKKDSKDLAILSKELATIKRNVPIEVNIEDLRLKDPDTKALTELFKDLEFRSRNIMIS